MHTYRFEKIPAVWLINIAFLVTWVLALAWAGGRDEEEVRRAAASSIP